VNLELARELETAPMGLYKDYEQAFENAIRSIRLAIWRLSGSLRPLPRQRQGPRAQDR